MYDVFGKFVFYRDGKFVEFNQGVFPHEVGKFLDAALKEDAADPSLSAVANPEIGTLMESIDSGYEGYDLYKLGRNIWYVDYVISNGEVIEPLQIIITSLADYMAFRAAWLAPIATKVVQAIQHDELRQAIIEPALEKQQQQTVH